ncbi:hypothetical protein ISS30_03655 [bacterium]|nr:hypothetical protein [bacterium]
MSAQVFKGDRKGRPYIYRSPFTVDYFQIKPSCSFGAPPSMKIGLLARGRLPAQFLVVSCVPA